MAPQLSKSFDRVRYQVGHRTLAAVLGVGAQLWHRSLNPTYPRPSRAVLVALQQWFHRLLKEDLANVEAGLYPRDLAVGTPVFELLRGFPEAITDGPRILWRKSRGAYDAIPEQVGDDYPAYYRRTFHWQTDGWFSAHSARVYEAQVEFLFFGTMALMRRQCLPPLTRELRDQPSAKILDVACGTGRLLRQLHVALPKARLFGIDLSPHYIQRAQAECKAVSGLSLLVGNAESLPLADETFDAVTCGFLFHEMPHDARRRVVAEARRVLKPGGLLVIEDSMQYGDPNGDELAYYLDWFPRTYHEPYYKGYTRDRLEDLCVESGLKVESSAPILLSKLVVARKRAA